MTRDDKLQRYREVNARLDALLEGESDWVSAMATVACELHHAFETFNWTGFYRVVAPELLKIGPYQGPHGCLSIAMGRGVCGVAAQTGCLQVHGDVTHVPHHIACSPSTRAEIVVPIVDATGHVHAVLDVDSDTPFAFDADDEQALEALCTDLGRRFFGEVAP